MTQFFILLFVLCGIAMIGAMLHESNEPRHPPPIPMPNPTEQQSPPNKHPYGRLEQ